MGIPRICGNCEFWEHRIKLAGRCNNVNSCVYGVMMGYKQDCTYFIPKTKNSIPLKHSHKKDVKRVMTVLDWRRGK